MRGVYDAVMDQASVDLKKVLLPREHGAWGMLAEPIVVGLIAVGMHTDVAVGLVMAGAVTGFFARRPLLVGWFSRAARGDGSYRTARAWAIGLGLAAAGMIGGAWVTAGDRQTFAIALGVAVGLGLVQLVLEVGKRGRSVGAEWAGAVALSMIVVLMVAHAGGACGVAWVLGGAMAAKQVATVGYIRLRLRAVRDMAEREDYWIAGVGLAALIGVMVWCVMPTIDIRLGEGMLELWLGSGEATWRAAGPMGLIGVRIGVGMAMLRRPVVARRLGMLELVVGLVFAVWLGSAVSLVYRTN